MTCPRCQSHHTEPILSWTSSGRKMTVPLVRMWACLNRECRHQWPRELTSPIVGLTQEVVYDPCKGSLSLSPSILDGNGH
jgi:hypothetical protein